MRANCHLNVNSMYIARWNVLSAFFRPNGILQSPYSPWYDVKKVVYLS